MGSAHCATFPRMPINFLVLKEMETASYNVISNAKKVSFTGFYVFCLYGNLIHSRAGADLGFSRGGGGGFSKSFPKILTTFFFF